MNVIRSTLIIHIIIVITTSKKVGCYNVQNCFKPHDCAGIKNRYPNSISGVYEIYPGYTGFGVPVYCDMERSCGGWTVIQRRTDGTINFLRGWTDYKFGFGKPDKEHWLGNDIIHDLTKHGQHELLIVMEDFHSNVRYAHYGAFSIGSENEKYKLNITKYSGNAGDSLNFHQGFPFTTKDKDNDSVGYNCAVRFEGAWWYNNCHQSNLNGRYLRGVTKTFANGVVWKTWKGYNYSLRSSVMMIR